jgi:uncharacterized protein
MLRQMSWLVLKQFPCNSCSLCCQNIGHIEPLRQNDRGDGVCKYLENNQCSIYEDRPLICRIDDMYDQVYHKYFSKHDYYVENAKSCKILQKEFGLSEEDQLDLSKYWGNSLEK